MKSVTITWDDDTEADNFLTVYHIIDRYDHWNPGHPAIMKKALRAARELRINAGSGSDDTDQGGRNIQRTAG